LASFFHPLFRLFTKRSVEDRDLSDRIFNITGAQPVNLNLYKLALRHSSVSQNSDTRAEHNERLEFLGDAVLGILIAEFLFKRFPFKNEGFLTEIRSRIVNGEALNILAGKIGLDKLIRYEGKRKQNHTHRSMYGDAMEALVGAVYLDLGFLICKRFVIDRLIKPNYDLDEVVESETNHKSRLIEWSQRNGYVLKFDIIKEAGRSHTKEFTCQVNLSGTAFSTGSGYSKKKAEQDSAFKALEKIKVGKLEGLDTKPLQKQDQRQKEGSAEKGNQPERLKTNPQEKQRRNQDLKAKVGSARVDPEPKLHTEKDGSVQLEVIAPVETVAPSFAENEPIKESGFTATPPIVSKQPAAPAKRKWVNVLKEDQNENKTDNLEIKAPEPLNWDSEWDTSFGTHNLENSSQQEGNQEEQ